MMKKTFGLAAVVSAALCAPAAASTVTAESLLADFNTIVLGDLDATAETEGTVFVGGNVTQASTVNRDLLDNGNAAGSFGALVVGGNVGGNSFAVESGDIVIGGDLNTTINNNGGGTVTIGGDLNGRVQGGDVAVGGAVDVDTVRGIFTSLSYDLSQLTATPGSGVDTDQNNLNIFSGNGIDGISVVSAPDGFLQFGGSNNRFSGIDTTITTIVNIGGLNPILGANIEATIFDTVLLNFFEAETLTINSGVSFSILSPFADVTSQGGGINGTVVAGNLRQQSEIRSPNFGGTIGVSPVPLPAGAWLLLAGFGAFGFVRRTQA